MTRTFRKTRVARAPLAVGFGAGDPQNRKPRDRMRNMTASATRIDEMLAKFEAGLIDSYFRMVENLISDAKNMSKQSWRVVDIADFEANGLQRP
jgi:hypothetical protein